MAFNHIYTVFREETTLIDQFSFEVLVVYVHSLALAHHDDKALGKMVFIRVFYFMSIGLVRLRRHSSRDQFSFEVLVVYVHSLT